MLVIHDCKQATRCGSRKSTLYRDTLLVENVVLYIECYKHFGK